MTVLGLGSRNHRHAGRPTSTNGVRRAAGRFGSRRAISQLALPLSGAFVLAAALPASATAQDEDTPNFGIQAIPASRMRAEKTQLAVAAGVERASPGDRLILVPSGMSPVWAVFDRTVANEHLFRVKSSEIVPVDAETTAWLIPSDIAARTLPTWPTGTALHGQIDTVGPGGRSAWVRVAPGVDLRSSDTFWRRVAGQPLGRLDVRFAAGGRAYCAVVPLAAEARLHQGERVALWRTDRDGGARSAVCFVASETDGAIVWIAAPRHVDVPDETRVEFHRRGAFIADGTVERRDGRFWYVRTTPTTSIGQPRVGDNALIRTRSDIERRRYVARVFESQPRRFLINAGEVDGLHGGDKATVYRDGSPAGAVEIVGIQRTFALVRGLPDHSADWQLQAGDKVRFAPPPAPPRVIGLIRKVSDESLLTVDVAAPPPLFKMLAVHDGTRTVAAAMLVEFSGRRATGFVIGPSIDAPITPGMNLLRDSDHSTP